MKNVTVQENVKIRFLADFHTYSAVTKTSYKEEKCIPSEVVWTETWAPSIRAGRYILFPAPRMQTYAL
jgi:hypothetical protein